MADDPNQGAPKQREEAAVEVPARGGGPPEESKEPVFAPGPNPELADDRKAVAMVRPMGGRRVIISMAPGVPCWIDFSVAVEMLVETDVNMTMMLY